MEVSVSEPCDVFRVAGTVFIGQNLTSTDVTSRFWRIRRIKTVPAVKGLSVNCNWFRFLINIYPQQTRDIDPMLDQCVTSLSKVIIFGQVYNSMQWETSFRHYLKINNKVGVAWSRQWQASFRHYFQINNRVGDPMLYQYPTFISKKIIFGEVYSSTPSNEMRHFVITSLENILQSGCVLE